MRRLIGSFDALVRRVQGVFEFSADPACLLRLRRTRLAHPLTLTEGRFPVGAKVLEIHLWNERVPPLPRSGADLVWASQAAHQLRRSLRTLAAYVITDETWHDARLVGGTTILADGAAAEHLLQRLGFELRPHPLRHGPLIESWQNLYALGLMAVFNPPSVRRRSPASLRRTDLWMPMASFLRRYALTPNPSPAERERGRG